MDLVKRRDNKKELVKLVSFLRLKYLNALAKLNGGEVLVRGEMLFVIRNDLD